MMKQLPESEVDRRNILNNDYAISAMQEQVGIQGVNFENELKFTVRQVARFFEVETRTVERYIVSYAEELRTNGYEVLSGKRLEDFKADIELTDIHVGKNAPRLGIFNFKALINLSMLLVESEKARVLRQLILNVVIDVISQKTGGTAKYINQRDDQYLLTLYAGENYRKDFTDALKDCVDMGNFKYAVYTDKIYKSIFKEKAREYRKILSLTTKENVRDTMYSEVLTTISMYETGLANELRKVSAEKGRKLFSHEVDVIFGDFESNPLWKPQLDTVRSRMASRDYGFRDVMHPELAEYVNPLNSDEFERFLGNKSAELADRIEEYKEIFKRLKDK
jgi:hypothetical protein